MQLHVKNQCPLIAYDVVVVLLQWGSVANQNPNYNRTVAAQCFVDFVVMIENLFDCCEESAPRGSMHCLKKEKMTEAGFEPAPED